MEKSFIFNSVNGDRRMKAEDFREIFIPFFDNGVFPNPSSKLQVIENAGMNVIIQEGKAFIQGAIYINTGDLVLTLDHADGVLNRIDRIVLRMDTLERKITCKVKKGAYASSPVPPSLQRDPDAFEICLAEILVSKGVIDIKQSMITDTRLNTQICGIVTGLVKEIDTTTLYNQLQAAIVEKGLEMNTWIQGAKDYFSDWISDTTVSLEGEFNTWFDGIKGALDGDIAGNLLNKINALEEVVNTMELTSTKVTRPNQKTVEESLSANEISISEHETSILNLQNEVNGQRLRGINIANSLLSKI